MSKTILLIGALDTKGEEVLYLRNLIQAQGIKTLVMDTGILGPVSFPADIPRQEVARAGGRSIRELVRLRDRGVANATMINGARSITLHRFHRGNFHGLLAVGGAQGTEVGTAAMRALPFGVPKLMISAVACGEARFGPFMGTRDITIMHSVVDVLGLNSFMRQILRNAAAAIVGMVQALGEDRPVKKPRVAMTMYGTTTPGCMHAKSLLEREGYEVVTFHPNGTGGRAMEEMITEGYFTAVLDLTTHELTDELVGGGHRAGPHRLEAAAQKGIPQVVGPGSLCFIIAGPLATLPVNYRRRKHVVHNPNITLVRTSKREMIAVAGIMARKLNPAIGPVRVVIPLQGFSYPNRKREALYDEEGNLSFIRTLKKNLLRNIEVIEVDAHINDSSYAEKAVESLKELIEKKEGRKLFP
jgi:uncharacterized protein (UPF0261 family)